MTDDPYEPLPWRPANPNKNKESNSNLANPIQFSQEPLQQDSNSDSSLSRVSQNAAKPLTFTHHADSPFQIVQPNHDRVVLDQKHNAQEATYPQRVHYPRESLEYYHFNSEQRLRTGYDYPTHYNGYYSGQEHPPMDRGYPPYDRYYDEAYNPHGYYSSQEQSPMYSGNSPYSRHHYLTYPSTSHRSENDGQEGYDNSLISSDRKRKVIESLSNRKGKRPKKLGMFPDEESLNSWKREHDGSQDTENIDIINELFRQITGNDDQLGYEHIDQLNTDQIRNLIKEFIIAKICLLTGETRIYRAPWHEIGKILRVQNWPTSKVLNVKHYKRKEVLEFAKNMLNIKFIRIAFENDIKGGYANALKQTIARNLKEMSGKYFLNNI
jgi:hypothetical protein